MKSGVDDATSSFLMAASLFALAVMIFGLGSSPFCQKTSAGWISSSGVITAFSVSTVVARGIGIVGLDCDGFDLRAGTAADVKCRRDFAFFTGSNLLFLGLRSRATTGGMDRRKMDRGLAHIFILEMRNCLFVAQRRLQIDRSLLPLQLRARTLGQRS